MSIRVVTRRFEHKASVGIWLFDDRPGGMHSAVPIQLQFKKVPGSDDCFRLPEPLLEVRFDRYQTIFQQLADQCAEMGFRPNTDRIAGELVATKGHLEREKGTLDRLFSLLEQKL